MYDTNLNGSCFTFFCCLKFLDFKIRPSEYGQAEGWSNTNIDTRIKWIFKEKGQRLIFKPITIKIIQQKKIKTA